MLSLFLACTYSGKKAKNIEKSKNEKNKKEKDGKKRIVRRKMAAIQE